MQWLIKQGDILNDTADVLICSANVYLNLSGGVGGEILLRYGTSMQDELRHYLASRAINHVARGTVVATGSCGTQFSTVLHAIAVNGFYESSSEVISQVVHDALGQAAALDARSVALVALATGYGRLSMSEFGASLLPLAEKEYPPIKRVVVCVRKLEHVEELLRVCTMAKREHRKPQ